MQMKETNDASKNTLSLRIAEYTALRDEILKRMDVESQFTTFTVIIFGTILGIGLQNKNASLILLYPILATFFSIAWSHSNHMIFQLGTYLKEHIESVVGVDVIGWEHYRTMKPHYAWAARGIFLTTEMLAIVLAVSLVRLNTTFLALLLGQSLTNPDITVNILLCFAFISLLLTFFILYYTPRDHIQKLRKPIESNADRDQKG